MTFAPQKIKDVAAFLVTRGFINSGIVGDTAHAATGTSYHLGKSQLTATAYSRVTARDKAGLSEAASALDLNHSTKTRLRAFSVWLVEQCRENDTGTADIREVIYSPDGSRVFRWDRERGYSSLPVLSVWDAANERWTQGDMSHLWHTHISWYRDSEFRTKTGVFEPFFSIVPPDTSTGVLPMKTITDTTPKLIDWPAGRPYYGEDGTTRIGATGADQVDRFSPFGCGTQRAFYVGSAPNVKIGLVTPDTVSDVIPPVDTTPYDQADLTAAKAVGVTEGTAAGKTAEKARLKTFLGL